MRALSAAALAAADPAGMAADVLAQPHQLADALWRFESAGVRAHERPGGLCVCGMGGSAIGADLAFAALDGRARRPLQLVRGYSPPPWAGPETLALCASYSGETEETVAAYDSAREAGMPRVVLTTGGSLADRARADGVPVIGVPSGMQPRAAVVYMTVCTLAVAASCGAAPDLRAEIEAAAEPLAARATEWGPDAPSDSPAKRLAARLYGSIPVVYGAGPTAAAAIRWKTQLNENAKLPAFSGVLSEADHNDICGWRDPSGLAAIYLDDPGLDVRLRRRISRTAELVAPAATTVEHVEAAGRTPFERLLALVLLGDLVSVYLAVLRGVDPTPVEPIERLKAALAKP